MNKEKVLALFEDANFIKGIGIQPVRVKEGALKTKLNITSFHLQQHQFIHAGVISAIADHSAGAVATTLIDDDEEVLTVEFKINFLRPATGNTLFCDSKVIRGGRTIIVAESEVYSKESGKGKLFAKALVTLAVVKKSKIL
ncbi:MAG: PaaI family thioesterase [Proteobacteria bacterium]|nr:PaaI family thioesterase [Pseudomonadota bacterium]